MKLTKDDIAWIRQNTSFGFDEISKGQMTPWIAVPNRVMPDGSIRKYSLEQILAALRSEDEPAEAQTAGQI